MDPYEILGVKNDATLAEIKKVYRKKSLTCHPDKNPHKREAAAEFYKLSEAIKLLSDEKARAAYDEKTALKRRAKEHSRQLDGKRRKFKEDLEAREAFYKRTKSEEERSKVELQKLQKDGERLLEEEAFIEKQRIHKLCEQFYKKESRTRDFIIKIRWKTQESDPFNGGYNYDILHKMFSKYGDVVALVVSSAKKGKALVTFADKSAAETALLQTGLIRNPLILSGLWRDTRKRTHLVNGISTSLSFASAPDIFAQVRYRMSDAESEVLSDLKKAEERKRLLEDLKAQEEKET